MGAVKQHTILLVEDEPLIRMDIAAELRARGFEVVEAARAIAAIDLLMARSIPIDLLLTDVQMPGEMDGLDLARWAGEHHPGLVLAVMSASREAVAQALALSPPPLVFLKPIETQPMARAFEAALGEPTPDRGADVA
jgi:DNA-binding NarL/FixJ family response regulator